MAEESALQPPEGLYFDELSKIRLLDPEKGQQTEELKEQCKAFVESEHGVGGMRCLLCLD